MVNTTSFKNLILVIVSLVLFLSCSNTADYLKPVFKPRSLQDSLVCFINNVDSIPDPSGNPTLIYVILYEYEGRPHVDFEAEAGALLWPEKDPDTSENFCSGRYIDKYLFVSGNPKYGHFVYRKNLKLSKSDKAYLKGKRESMLTEQLLIPENHKEYILSPEGEVIEVVLNSYWESLKKK